MKRQRKVHLEKPLRSHEAAFLEACRRSAALHRCAVRPPRDAEQFRAYLNSLRRDDKEAWLIVHSATSALAGVVNVSEIVRGGFQSGYLGYYAFAPLAGQGYMTLGLAKVVSRCFRELKLHRLEANIQPWNARSIALVARLRFVKEGYSRRYLKISGRWQDHERWAMLSEDWKPGALDVP